MIINLNNKQEVQEIPETFDLSMSNLQKIFNTQKVKIKRKNNHIEILVDKKELSEENKAKIRTLLGV